MSVSKYKDLLGDIFSVLENYDKEVYNSLREKVKEILENNNYMFEVSREEDIIELFEENKDFCRCAVIIAISSAERPILGEKND